MDAPVRCAYANCFDTRTSADDILSIEIPGEEEEHRQLPPDENVPEGRGSAEEGRCAGLNAISTPVPRYFSTGYSLEFGFFDILRELTLPTSIPLMNEDPCWSKFVTETNTELVASVQYIPLCTCRKESNCIINSVLRGPHFASHGSI